MRTPLIAGNWKMNLNRAECLGLAKDVAEGTKGAAGVEVAVFPPSVYLDAVRTTLAGSSVKWGTQNVCDEQKPGAGGEIQLTDAMAQMCGRGRFHGYRFEGKRFDCGDKAGFLEANIAYALRHPKIGKVVRETVLQMAQEMKKN